MVVGLILTLDEEINIKDCLESLSFVDAIYVVDSFSSDRTVQLAEDFGAIVLKRKFDNYAAQRNFALESIPDKYDWVLMLDADERVTNDLQKEIINITSDKTNQIALYRVRRKDYFMGKWLRYSSGYPTWFGRLFRNGKVKVEREINEEYNTKGEVGFLEGHLNHYPFSKGLDWWFSKHNLYSTMEAKVLMHEKRERLPFNYFFSKDPLIRRKKQKRFIYSLPFRPYIVFIIFYFVKLGVLDGFAGLTFCRLRLIYEKMIALKIAEAKRK